MNGRQIIAYTPTGAAASTAMMVILKIASALVKEFFQDLHIGWLNRFLPIKELTELPLKLIFIIIYI